MNYLATFRPIGPQGRPEASVVDVDGSRYQTLTGSALSSANVTKSQAYTAALAGATNNSTVASAAVANTVQPSSAQLAGLLAYLALIQAGSSTTAVETALGL